MKTDYIDKKLPPISFVSFGAVAEYAHTSLKDIKLVKKYPDSSSDVRYDVVVAGEPIGYIAVDDKTIDFNELLDITKNYYKYE